MKSMLSQKTKIAGIVGLGIFLASTTTTVQARPPHFFADPNPMVVFGPKPDYPYEARRKNLTGSCVALLDIDPQTGIVTNVELLRRSGHEVLDRSVLSRLREWKFKPGVHGAKIPVAFTMGGKVMTEVTERSRSVSEILAPVLGPNAVVQGSMPVYPTYPPWMNRQGKGAYELHAGPDGRITEVKILRASGDATFDRVTVETLRKWRLRTGPKIIELPLAFKLTPTSYDVSIP